MEVNDKGLKRKPPDYNALRPQFGWLPVDIIKKTFEATTQFARLPISTHLKERFKSPFPACNVLRRNENVATDTIFADVPAIDDGSRCAQIFVGLKSGVVDAYGVKSDKQFVPTLEDNIRRRGAPDGLISDCAQAETSHKVQDILRAYHIADWQSEPHRQQQNPAERRYQTVKHLVNTIMDRVSAPAYTWLLCLLYVCFILNCTVCGAIGNRVPYTVMTGRTSDISPLLYFYFWEPVYYKEDDTSFPSTSPEKRGRFVGIAEHVGHAMTFKILTYDTNKVI